MAAAKAPAADETTLKFNQLLKDCLSCRLVCGGGLFLSGAYVFHAARKVMRQGAPTSMGTIAQVTFAASLVAWGMVVVMHPMGSYPKKT